MSTTNLNTILPVETQGYLTASADMSSSFVELIVYDVNGVLINENLIYMNTIQGDSLYIYDTKFIMNPGVHLRSLGYSAGTYKVKYNFFKKVVGNFDEVEQTATLKKISPSRTELEVVIPTDVSSSIKIEIDNFLESDKSKLVYYTFFGSDRNFLIINNMLYNKDLLLKLYEELPADIDILTRFTIVEKYVESYEDTITLRTSYIDDLSNLNYLHGPKINYKAAGLTYRTTPLENFEALASTTIVKQDEITRLYLSSSLIEGIDINIDYRDFSQFIHFSSAEQRLKNFKSKMKKLEFYNSKLVLFASGSTVGSTGSSLSYYKGQKDEILNTFDQYEYFMYYETGSYESSSLGVFPDYTWPKYTNTNPYLLYPVTSSQASMWYASILVSASEYDNLNPNILTNTIPVEIVLDDQNSQYLTNIQMVGHMLDINYNYVNRMTSIHERQNCIFEGIPRELILPAINHYGFDLRSGNVIKGLVECIPISGSITGSVSDCSINMFETYENITTEVWKRILNNLPYLYKTKGTIRGLKALITCYGIPSTILYIREYGGPDLSNDTSSLDESNYALDNFTTVLPFTGGQGISLGWHTSSFGRYPSTVQIRFDTTGSAYTLANSMSLVEVADSWSLSVAQSGSNGYGYIKFELVGGPTISSSAMPIYDGHYTFVNLQRESGSDGAISQSFSLDAKKYDRGQILYAVSASVDTTPAENAAWRSPGTLIIGSGSFATPFYGQLDEFRLWETPLTEYVINSHVKFPESYIGNTLTGSFVDLLLRFAFDDPINMASFQTESIVNNAASLDYDMSGLTIFGWPDAPTFPYSFTTDAYEGEAHALNIGMNRYSSNKVRVEGGTLNGPLSSVTFRETGEYDNAQLDSNKLGIYFSPTELINEDIIKTLAVSDIGDLIGDPGEVYSSSYSNLEALSRLYWKYGSNRISTFDYMNYIKYYDPSLFDHIKEFIPARCQTVLGVMYEPTVLERAKVQHNVPVVERLDYSDTINMPSQAITSSYDNYNLMISMSYVSITSSNFEKSNIYTILTVSEIYAPTGNLIEMIVPMVDFDHSLRTYSSSAGAPGDIGSIKFSLTQSYDFVTRYHPRHYRNFEGYYTWERRLKYEGCMQNENTTTDQLSPIEVWETNPNKLTARDDGRSNLQVN